MKNAAKHVDIDVILKYRRAGIVAFLVLTLFFAFQLKGLNLVSDPMEPMYLSEHEFLQGMHDIDDMVPTLRMLVCILDLEQGDVYNTETIKKIDEISKGLTAIEGVLPGGIVSLSKGMDHYNNTADGLSIEPILGYAWPTTADEFAKLKRKVAINPMGPGKYVAYDSTAVMITANLTNIQQDARTAYNQLSEKDRGSFEKYEAQRVAAFNAGLLKGLRDLRSRIDDDNHHLYFMGQEVLTAQMTEMGKRDIPIAAVAMIVIIL
ncbi:MAG: hypothetical protein U9P80_09305, partial [Thermodesulfobacteriota bacterium]|nr:hypothetical protein [Thermodesulfobacteriota bacterium]